MKLTCLSLSLLVTTFSFASRGAETDGHSVGNGGGVICLNGKCQSLIEAGLQLSLEYNGVWLPKSEHYSLVKRRIEDDLILNTTLKKNIYLNTFAKTDHFRKVDVIDESKLDAIKKQYQAIFDGQGFVVDPNTFEVVAFSSDNTMKPAMTYLLPSFFKLSLEQQANFLIHEGLYRGRPTSDLKYILQLESSMEALKGRTDKCRLGSTGTGKFDLEPCINQQILAYRLNFIQKPELIGAIFSIVDSYSRNERPGSAFEVDAFGTIIEKEQKKQFQLDNAKLIDLATLEPRLPYMFSQVKSIPLTLVDRKSVFGSHLGWHFTVDWRELNPMQIIYCSPRLADTHYSDCDYYQFASPGSIRLLLPE